MKKIIRVIVAVYIFCAASVQISAADIKLSEENFPDNFFRIYVGNEFDTNKDGKLSSAERKKVKTIDIGEFSEFQLEYEYPTPYTLQGIEYFTELEELDCSACALSKIDTKRNRKLKRLYCNSNAVKKLDISKNKKLEVLACSNNRITALELKSNTQLKELYCVGNRIKRINVCNNKRLKKLSIADNEIKEIDTHSLRKLTDFYCEQNQISKLDVTKNKELHWLSCYENQIKKLNLKKNVKLGFLACSDNKLKNLDLSRNKLLEYLYCENNSLLTGNIKLGYSQLIRADISPQRRIIRAKKIGKHYYIPLKGVNKTNAITNLSTGVMTERGIRLKGKKLPKKITYEYNMFTDGKEKTKVEIKVKKKRKKSKK